MSDTSLPTLIQKMQQPDFYPHPVQEPIQLIQTHISYVLLTGDYAYKLKKPLNLGFLDFSTLEQRHHFCQEELRLNQRGADRWYLQVLPITQQGDSYQLNGDGEPVEYTLQMKQFPQDGLFVGMLEQGKLTTAHMETVGKLTAQYHAKSQTSDYILSFGKPETIKASIDENYRQTEKYVNGPQTRKQLGQTKTYTDKIFQERAPLFQGRIEEKKIRECHGDLHLKNLALYNGEIILFDCIEFNESFRFVDTMYDVAFMVMDTESKERPDLGNAFLNTYLEQTGDWEGLPLLPLYLSRQAYVRAKVTSLLLDDANVPDSDKQAAAETAAHYYYLSWQYTQPTQGQMVMMSGLSGSGKSTVAKQVARHNRAIHLRTDAVRKHLAGIGVDQKGDDSIYTPEMSEKTYNRMLELGKMLAAEGWTVILDGKYDRVAYRKTVLDGAKSQNLPVTILHCTADEEVLRDRLNQRKGDIADATSDLLNSQKAKAEAFTQAEQPYVCSVDTTKDILAQLPENLKV